MITKLPSDGVIRENGQYQIPLDVYHTQLCDAPSISSSGLRTIYTKSPADFWCYSDLNANRFARPRSDAFDFGKAAHALLLGDEDWEGNYVIRPDEWSNWQSGEAREWRDMMWNAGMTIVTPEDLEHIKYMSDSLNNHSLVGPLFDGEAEQSLIWKDKTGVWLKSRIDMLPVTSDQADLKTTMDASKRAVFRDIRKHEYAMQIALSDVGSEVVLGKSFLSSVLVFIQKTPPYHVTPIEISAANILYGKLKLRKAINLFADCLESGDWPGPVEGIPVYEISDNEEAEIVKAQENGELPNVF